MVNEAQPPLDSLPRACFAHPSIFAKTLFSASYSLLAAVIRLPLEQLLYKNPSSPYGSASMY